jgi:hypothetical protein
MDLNKFIAELKRRRVFRVAAVYVATAFVLAQAADIFFPGLGAPDWALRVVLALLVLAFPVVVLLAWAFDLTPEGVVRTAAADEDHAPLRATRLLPRRTVRFLGATVLLALLVGAGWLARAQLSAGPDEGLDGNLVTVLPFRVSADPSLAYLRDGMLDLLAASLPSDGLRASDPRTVLSALRRMKGTVDTDLPPDSALLLARSMGAGQLLLGGVVGSPGALTISAELRSVGTGRITARARVAGSPDSLTVLVDRLARQILALESGERDDRASLLADVPTNALREYLRGRAAARRGDYSGAMTHYAGALSHDSTFVLAALEVVSTHGWAVPVGSDVLARARSLAWSQRDRLSTADRHYLTTFLGPRYPEPFTFTEQIESGLRATEAAPDRADLWAKYADKLMHFGSPAGVANADVQAARAFDRALALDSSAVLMADLGPHRVELAILHGDTARALHMARWTLEQGAGGEVALYMRWKLALLEKDSTELAAVRAVLSAGESPWAGAIRNIAQNGTVDLETAEHAARGQELRATSPTGQAWDRVLGEQPLALNRGQPGRATRILAEAAGQLHADAPNYVNFARVTDALFWDGDSAAAAAAVRATAPLEDEPWSDDSGRRHDQVEARCWNGLWRLRHGDTSRARRTAADLAAFRSDEPPEILLATLCHAMHEGMMADLTGAAERDRLLDRLDSLTTQLPSVHTWLHRAALLTLAHLYDRHGDPDRALQTLRRGYQWGGNLNPYLSTFLREEGRLAAITGDTTGAARAWNHYLRLRADAEPALRPQVDQIRDEFRRLVRSDGR